MNSRVKISTLIGAVVLLATVLLFLLARPMVFPSTVLGFVFIMYSEIVFFGGISLAEYWSSKYSNLTDSITGMCCYHKYDFCSGIKK